MRQFLIGSAEDLDAAFAELKRDRVDALMVQPSLPRRKVFDFGLDQGIATSSPFPGSARAGALLSYNADTRNFYRLVSDVLDKVIRGANPATIPVALPTEFYLAINMRTARALSLEVPPSLLARADEVIE